MSSANDLAVLGFGISAAGMEPGRKAVHSALDGIQTKATSVIASVQKLAKQVNDTLNLVNGGSSGASRIEADVIRTQSRITQITAQEQQRRESGELRHQQRISEVQQRGATQTATIQARQTAQATAELNRRESSEQKSQQRIVEIVTRGNEQRSTIDTRRLAQLAVIHGREQEAELRHQQKLVEIAAREKARASTLPQTLTSVGSSLSVGVTAPLLLGGREAVRDAASLDSIKLALKAVSKDSADAEAQLRRLREIAKLPGIGFEEAVQGSVRLQAVGFDAKTAERALKGFANAVALTGGGKAQLESVTIQLGQLSAKGKVLSQDLRPIIEAAPAVAQALEHAFGSVSSDEIQKQLEASGKSSKDFINILLTELERLPKVTGGFQNTLDNFSDNTKRTFATFGDAIFKTLGPSLDAAGEKLVKLADQFAALPASTQTALVGLGVFAAGLGPVLFGVGQLITSVSTLITTLKSLAGLRIFAGLAGGTGAALGFGALSFGAAAGAGYLKFREEIKKSEGAIDSAALSARRAAGDFEFLNSTVVDIHTPTVSLKATQLEGQETSINFQSQSKFGQFASGLKVDDTGKLTAQSAALGTLTASQLQLAQARARLLVTNKNYAEAEKVISDALARTQKDSIEAIRLQTQLSQIKNKESGGAGGGGVRRAESLARQDRSAQESLDQARVKSFYDIQEKLTKNQVEVDREAFERRLLSADEYYGRLLDNELKLQGVDRRRIQDQIDISEERRQQARSGSPEELRELGQQIELQKQLRILELDRPNILRKINGELERTKQLEDERNRQAIASAALGGPGAKALERFNADFDARRQVELGKPETDLRREEQRLRSLSAQGIIRETTLTDALTIARRNSRDEIVKSLERQRSALQFSEDPNRFKQAEQLTQEIEAAKGLGLELTRTERLRKRFSEQGVLDYTRLNEGVEDLLAEQKGLTEIFADFRTNTAKDLFSGIDSGIDALTKRFGVLGNAVGQLLKDLAKLAATKLIEKVLGLNQNQQQSAGGNRATGGQGGGGFNPLQLLTGGGGSGGGGGSFLTPSFNPAGSGGGGGYGGGGASSGSGGGGGFSIGGFNLGSVKSVVSKIPGLGKLFGGVGAASGPGSATGAAAFGTLDANGIPIGLGSGGASGGAAGAGAGAAGSLASLGATGLVGGGAFLGSLAGGKSQIGRLIGGAGGALLGGVLGASGLLGGTLAAALPAFFTNPITAIIGAGLIGTALLFKFFGNKDFKKFQKETDTAYQLKVKDDKPGQELFGQIKSLGEASFGKGQFKTHIAETIRLDQAKQVLAAYGESTGQQQSELVKRTIATREIGSETNSANQFARRAFGGPVAAGQSYIVGDGGRSEVFTPHTSGYVHSSMDAYQQAYLQRVVQSLQSSKALGGVLAGAKQSLINQAQAQLNSATPANVAFNADRNGSQQRQQPNGGNVEQSARQDRTDKILTFLTEAVSKLSDSMDTFTTASPDSILQKVNPKIVTEKNNDGLRGNANAKQDLQRNLGI